MILALHKRLFSTNKFALQKGIIDSLTDPMNPLKFLPAERNSSLFSSLSEDEMLRLRLKDWHRVFENITPRDWTECKISPQIQDKSLYFLSKMKSLGITPDAFIYSSLCKIFSDDFKKAQEFYQFALKSEKSKFYTVIDFRAGVSPVKLVNNRSIQTMLEIFNSKHKSYQLKNLLFDLWDDLRTVKINPTTKTLISFLKSKGIENTGDFVSNIHQKLTWRKTVLKEKWDQEIYGALMNAYSRMGFFDVVDKLYVEMKVEGIQINR
jgi:pentatricopeptide repeat protein